MVAFFTPRFNSSSNSCSLCVELSRSQRNAFRASPVRPFSVSQMGDSRVANTERRNAHTERMVATPQLIVLQWTVGKVLNEWIRRMPTDTAKLTRLARNPRERGSDISVMYIMDTPLEMPAASPTRKHADNKVNKVCA